MQAKGSDMNGFVLRQENNYRVFFQADSKTISPWHDVPLYADKAKGILNFINEIPKGTCEKMEVTKDERYNPIKQDVKMTYIYKPRMYPFESLVNYGCLPQTWEDPEHKDESTGYKGDNDPIDVVEVGDRVARCGEVYQVKLLGILGLVDEGEMDWKVIAIRVSDPLASQLDSLEDLEKHMPGKVASLVSWFKYYKVPDGKPENSFAFDDKPMDKEFAYKIVDQTHELYKNKANLKKQGFWVE